MSSTQTATCSTSLADQKNPKLPGDELNVRAKSTTDGFQKQKEEKVKRERRPRCVCVSKASTTTRDWRIISSPIPEDGNSRNSLVALTSPRKKTASALTLVGVPATRGGDDESRHEDEQTKSSPGTTS
ncbi:unnamed protein product [Pleuronectes platessa]|uniref:Uncharacterized protein n=1 Tax=Pleuronectes platessa TaxID=8262 RepID=A0A9N7THU0_PLEPL|nr:unnamed protein product [Pleuronectes platessa]